VELNIVTKGGTHVLIHDELKGDTESRCSMRRARLSGYTRQHDVVDRPLRWFSDITEGEMFTLVFSPEEAYTFVCKTLTITSGSCDPRHTCPTSGYCPGCYADVLAPKPPVTEDEIVDVLCGDWSDGPEGVARQIMARYS
jgi:hypothetical protein